jgi:hypothetical protein
VDLVLSTLNISFSCCAAQYRCVVVSMARRQSANLPAVLSSNSSSAQPGCLRGQLSYVLVSNVKCLSAAYVAHNIWRTYYVEWLNSAIRAIRQCSAVQCCAGGLAAFAPSFCTSHLAPGHSAKPCIQSTCSAVQSTCSVVQST